MKIKLEAEVRQAFHGVGADTKRRVIVYCGGGVVATLDAFLLRQLGF